MKWLKLLKARRAVVLAAKCVESSFEPSLLNQYDSDDLHDLRVAVRELRAVESGES